MQILNRRLWSMKCQKLCVSVLHMKTLLIARIYVAWETYLFLHCISYTLAGEEGCFLFTVFKHIQYGGENFNRL